MKHLKTSLSDLRRLFVRTVTLRDIAEPLVSFDESQSATEVQQLMAQREYDVAGVREHGMVTGCVAREHLSSGTVGAHQRDFAPGEVLPDSEPLIAAFTALRERGHVFISVFGQAGGIVTRGDLQKAPVRLWLFGLVSLLEMQLLRIVRERFPGEQWTALLTEGRVENARKVFAERQRRNEANDLSDCLQLCDKAKIFAADPSLRAIAGFESKRALDGFFNDVEQLRNALSHANDILQSRWPALADLAASLEWLLVRLEATHHA